MEIKKSDDTFELKTRYVILVIVLFAFLTRCAIAFSYQTPIDISYFNIPWALDVNKNLFNVYSISTNLDYPPLFPSLLWFVSGAVTSFVQSGEVELQMLFIKLIPIIFDCMIIVMLYFFGKKHSEKIGLLLASVWAVNISTIFNCSFWGQTDSIMLFLLGMTVLSFDNEKPIVAMLFFALGCLTKLQMAYFAPIVLLELFFRYKPLKAIKSLLVGLTTGILGWMPFMLGSSNVMLPFDIYFGGFNSYNYINLNAFNIYGFFEERYMSGDRAILFGNIDEYTGIKMGGLSFNRLSIIFTCAIVLALIVSYILAKKNGYRVPVSLNAMMFINSIFMLSTKMHERYQIPILILLIISYITCKNAKFFKAFVIAVVITFLNQSFFLFSLNCSQNLKSLFAQAQGLFSFINIILFIYLLVIYIDYHVKQFKLNKQTSFDKIQ